jgi:hypothetical protein
MANSVSFAKNSALSTQLIPILKIGPAFKRIYALDAVDVKMLAPSTPLPLLSNHNRHADIIE